MKPDYTIVTDIPGDLAHKEQLERIYSRYRFAADFCAGKDVLEVGCSCGIGLGYLARNAKAIVGTDIDERNLKNASEYYKGRSNMLFYITDAHNLSLKDKTFDVVILYETIYYLRNPEQFIKEAHRVLRGHGVLFISSVNKDWSDFNPSLYSIKYFSVPELFGLLKGLFSKVDIYGVFSINPRTLKVAIVSFLKRIAFSFRLIPKTMKGKKIIKKIFYGKSLFIPREITEDQASYVFPEAISLTNINKDYKIIYVMAYKT